MLRVTQYAGLIQRKPDRRYGGVADVVTSLFTGPKVPKLQPGGQGSEEEEARKRRREEERAAARRRGLGTTELAGAGELAEPTTRKATLLGGAGNG